MSKEKVEVLADSLEALSDNIAKVSEFAQAIEASEMSESTMIMIISHYSKIPQRDVKKVVSTMSNLSQLCLENE